MESTPIYDITLPRGDGIGKTNNKVVFIPYTVTGDVVEFGFLKKKKNYNTGYLQRIISPSQWRTTPLCRHFGTCGGCRFQHIQYEYQLQIKEKYLRETFRRIGNIDLNETSILPIVASSRIWHYRNKMEFSFTNTDGKVSIGLHKRDSFAEVLSIDECLLCREEVPIILQHTAEFINRHQYLAYNPLTHKGFLRHLIIRDGKHTGEILIGIVTTSVQTFPLEEYAEYLSMYLKGIKGWSWIINNRIADVVEFQEIRSTIGENKYTEIISEKRFMCNIQSFFQTNPYTYELLLNTVSKYIDTTSSENILDLYCGIGTIGLTVARKHSHITGIDISPTSIMDAEQNAVINGFRNTRYICYRLLKRLPPLDIHPDTIIIDPPRDGIHPGLIKPIMDLNARAIIYISCHPATMARDIRAFLSEGYRMVHLQPFDFFPHTPHLEVLSILERRS